MAVIVGVDFPPDEYEHIDTLAQNCTSSVERWFISWQEGRPQLWNLWEVMKSKRSVWELIGDARAERALLFPFPVTK